MSIMAMSIRDQQATRPCGRIIANASFPPSATRIAASTTTETRSNNGNDNRMRFDNGGNGNCDTQTTTQQSRTGTGNSPIASSTTSTRLPTHPSLQVQPEHHSSSNSYNCNRNAIQQWQCWQSRHTAQNGPRPWGVISKGQDHAGCRGQYNNNCCCCCRQHHA